MALAKDCAIKWESDRNVERTAVSFVAFRCKKVNINSQSSVDTAKKTSIKVNNYHITNKCTNFM